MTGQQLDQVYQLQKGFFYDQGILFLAFFWAPVLLAAGVRDHRVCDILWRSLSV
jgi:hypothetical protein